MSAQNKTVTYSQGDVILYEGEKSKGFYVLLSGTLGILKNNLKVGEISEKGTVFGEISTLLDIPRSTTVVAEGEVAVVPISMSLEEVIRTFPDIARQIMMQMAWRIVDLNHRQAICD